MESSLSSTTGQPRNWRHIRVSQQSKTKLRWPENSIEHQNVHRRRSSSNSSASISYVYNQAKLISTNPRSMEEECEYGLPRGTCFTARRLEVVSPGCCGYISWCVSLVTGGISCCFFDFLYFELTRPTVSTRQPCVMYLYR